MQVWFAPQKLSLLAHSVVDRHVPPFSTRPTHALVMQAAVHGSALAMVAQVSLGATSALRQSFMILESKRTRFWSIAKSSDAIERAHSRLTSSRHSASVRGSLTFRNCSISPSEQHWYRL
jgi:hypothetical protein